MLLKSHNDFLEFENVMEGMKHIEELLYKYEGEQMYCPCLVFI